LAGNDNFWRSLRVVDDLAIDLRAADDLAIELSRWCCLDAVGR
jgi:hypothetical protein